MITPADEPRDAGYDSPWLPYYCRDHRQPLKATGDRLCCAVCGPAAFFADGVASFIETPDEFYEGKYNNRTRYVPANDGVIATLPLRLVHQGYSTRVARELPAGCTVVEIGCAAGIDWFAKRYRMIGLDLSGAALRSAGQRYAAVAQCDATSMPLADSSVDGVISSCLFEHLLPEQKRRLLSEAYRVLKPGGKLIFFYDINTENPIIAAYRRKDPERYQRLFLDGDGHIGYEDNETNRQYFLHAGFDVLAEVYHERSPILANSVWQKLSQWPGRLGYAARLGKILTSGPMRIPSLAAIAAVDGTVGHMLPTRYARCQTTIARKT